MFQNDLANIQCKKETKNKVLLNSKISREKNIELVESIVNLSLEQDIVQKNVYNDLEIFKGLENEEESVFNVIDKTFTIFGRIYIENILKTPIKNMDTLKNRQNIFNKIDNKLLSSIQDKLKIVKELEEDVLWILRERNPEETKIIDSVYFTNKYLKMVNNNEDLMTIYSLFSIFFAPIYGIVSPLVFFILPYLYLYFFAKVKIGFKTYFEIFKVSIFGGFNLFSSNKNGITKYFSVMLSIIIYFQNFANTIKIAKSNYNIINSIHRKLNKLNKFIQTCDELFKETDGIFKLDKLDVFSNDLNNDLFNTEPSLLSNKGKILVTYKNVENIEKSRYKNYFNLIGEIDSYCSIVALVKHLETNNFNVCYTKYKSEVKPYINLKGVWHPYLSSSKKSDEVICNSICLGGSNPNNIVLTGPNAGGKSTFIKSVSLSLLFSHTFGISFSKEAIITPLSLINTYLNIPDCKNKESLFEAEMHRSRNYLKMLKELDKNDFSFIVMDEIFSSTNPEEGISGAYAICNKLSEYENSISIITTHFNYLTNLEKDGKFKNYHIPITRNEQNEIVYPYKLSEGHSNQHIALELLKNKGFDSEIVDYAINVCNEINSNKEHYMNSITDNEVLEEPEEEEEEDCEANSGEEEANSGEEEANSGEEEEEANSGEEEEEVIVKRN